LAGLAGSKDGLGAEARYVREVLPRAAVKDLRAALRGQAGATGRAGAIIAGFALTALETALRRRPYMNIYGSDYPTAVGTCVRDYVHVSDLARAHLAALDYLRSGGQSRTLNCGYGRGYSVREVVDAVRTVAGVDFETRQAPRRAGDPASIVANSDQLVSLGWKPELNDLSKMIEYARNWEKKLASVQTTARGRPSSVDTAASNSGHAPAVP
jgi:UDP-glucose 4-epimerase